MEINNNKRKMDMDKKNKIVSIIGAIVFSIVLVGIGYAYFSGAVSNANKETVTAGTASIALEFDDIDNGISGTLNLGQSITKKFTLKNTGTVDAYGKINWYNLVNTYTENSLTWTLEQSTSENGTYKSIGSGKVPTSTTEITKTLKNGILVPTNTTYYYKLTITLNNLDAPQNSDINGAFYSYFNLEEGSLSGAEQLMQLVSNANPNSTDVITKPSLEGATCTNTLAYDGTADNNLRYVGANPCNYVSFNNELWRIIGVMNNVDDGTGKKETRIKLIRATSLGNYSWDTSTSGVNGATSNYGINDWTQADLKNELNGDYLNTNLTANTMWYNGSSNQKTAEYDYTKGLKATAQAQIGNAKWHLGGMKYENNDLIPSTMYTKERGTEVWPQGASYSATCNDGACPRATEWTGKVALIYPSDYGYATSGGTTTNRGTCIGTLSTYYNVNTPGENWTNSSYSDCKNNDWLKSSSNYNWLLSPGSYNAHRAFSVSTAGYFSGNDTGYSTAVLPAVYLQSGVTISGGNGSPENPYTLNLE